MQNDINDYTVFNVSTKIELWLLKNFNLPCIQREVYKQLGNFFYQEIPNELKFKKEFIKDLNFKYPDTLYSIIGKNIFLYFYNNIKEEEITIYNKFLFYGTTSILDVINNALQGIKNYKKCNYKVQFSFCGLDLTYNKGKILYKGKEIFIPYMIPEFKNINLKHSYNFKEASNYNNTQIFVSGKNYIGNIDNYQNPNLKRILSTELPDYLYKQIEK